jgi:hypothetical protein
MANENTITGLVNAATDEVRRAKGSEVAERFRTELWNKVLVGQVSMTASAMSGLATGAAVLGPVGAIGGLILGAYFSSQNAGAKIQNLKYKYLYE